MRFFGKNVVVSGGASGLGKATATRFVKDGAKNVYLFDIDEKGGAAAAAELGRYGSVKFVKCDVSSRGFG